MIEQSFIKILSNVDGSVYPLTSDRIYPGAGPQNERRQRIVLTLLSKTPDYDMDGVVGFITGQMQVACLGPTYPDARAVADAAGDLLENFSGPVTGGLITIDYLQIDDESDIPAITPPPGQPLATQGIALTVNYQYQMS